MGLVNFKMRKWQINFIKYVTNKLHLVTISKFEQTFLEKE